MKLLFFSIPTRNWFLSFSCCQITFFFNFFIRVVLLLSVWCKHYFFHLHHHLNIDGDKFVICSTFSSNIGKLSNSLTTEMRKLFKKSLENTFKKKTWAMIGKSFWWKTFSRTSSSFFAFERFPNFHKYSNRIQLLSKIIPWRCHLT